MLEISTTRQLVNSQRLWRDFTHLVTRFALIVQIKAKLCAELMVNDAAEMSYCATFDSCGGRSITIRLEVGDTARVRIRPASQCRSLVDEPFNMFSGFFIK